MKNAMTLSGGFLRATILSLCLFAGMVFTTRNADATTFPPERMTYQGFLVNANGDALGQDLPASFDLVFSIWDEQTGGVVAKWGEQQTVTVDKGYFSVLLGEGAAVTEPYTYTNMPLSSVFAGDASSRYIEITVKGIGTDDADLTIRPRLQLVTSPYAFMATRASALLDGADDMVTVSPGAGIHVNGEVTATRVNGFGTIPIGGIIMWSGSSIPDGWALCNGGSGTPDLRNRFIVGSGSGYSTGATGGASSVALTKNQMPSHNHGGNTGSKSVYQPGSSAAVAPPVFITYVSGTRSSSSHTHSISSDGGGQSHENRPPYYALAFIMRVE